MKYLLVIGDGMADNPVPELDGMTPLRYAEKPVIDRLASEGETGSVVNCPPELPAGSETAILSIFGCDPRRYFTGRAPQEAAALGIPLDDGDVCYRCNIVTMDSGDMPYEEKRILSHSAGSISGADALEVVSILNGSPEFAGLLKEMNMEIPPVATFRPLAVAHSSPLSGTVLIPPHDHLGEKCGPLLPKGGARAEDFTKLQKTANAILEKHPFNERRTAEGKMPANGIWLWAEGTAVKLPDFVRQYGHSGAVVSAVPVVHGIGALRGLEKVEVEGATGEIDTNFEGKLEAAWSRLQEYDFVCLHLEAPDECTHNGDLKGKIQAIEWLDSRLTAPLVSRLEESGEDYRILLLSDHKTLTSNRGHDGDPAPYLLFDSRKRKENGHICFDEETCLKGEFIPDGSTLLSRLFGQ